MTVDRTIAPAIHDAVEFEYVLPPIHTETLTNGLPFYWLDAGVQEVVQIDWVVPGGVWQEQKPSVAHAVAALLKNGTSKHTAAEINDALEFYGAELKCGASNDYATVTLYTLTKHLPVLLPIVYEILTDATFPEYEVDLYKNNAIQKLAVNLRKSEFVANQRIDEMLFGEENPYGRFTKKENLEAVTRQDLVDFYTTHYSMADAKIFMAGKVGKQEVSYINDIFGSVAVTKSVIEQRVFAPHTPGEKSKRIINDEKGVQGSVRIGRLFPNRKHPDFSPMVVLNTLFGGYFGSRLMSNIREDKGFTYGIYSSITPEANGGSMIIHTETGREVVEDAIKEVYHEMEVLCQEEVSEDELLLVKNYLLGGLLADLDGPFSILRRWRSLILNGFTDAYFYKNIEIYKTITPTQLQELAKKYYTKDAFFEVVVV